MQSVAERAKKLVEELEMATYPHSEHVLDKLEQALLAERRLAMETALEIARNTAGAKTRIIEALRAAAEREVGK